eukprot:6193034-Pleurochrysis_carterae.AAC.1
MPGACEAMPLSSVPPLFSSSARKVLNIGISVGGQPEQFVLLCYRSARPSAEFAGQLRLVAALVFPQDSNTSLPSPISLPKLIQLLSCRLASAMLLSCGVRYQQASHQPH